MPRIRCEKAVATRINSDNRIFMSPIVRSETPNPQTRIPHLPSEAALSRFVGFRIEGSRFRNRAQGFKVIGLSRSPKPSTLH